ncbi:acyltransferase [Ideonella sp.]|uniref:acyltransferase n=1 Tax=Ideonella sp. TaxID=1929293 RepID=UPI003BB4E652
MLQKLKAWAKLMLYRPHGVVMGQGALVRRPWTISHPRYVSIGMRSSIGKGAILNAIRTHGAQVLAGEITIGADVYIGHGCQIHALQLLRIGDGCVLSDQVYINDASHGMDPKAGLIMSQPIHSKGPVQLHEHVFIGIGSVILAGVEIGCHSVVAAHSVVTRSWPAGSMVAGNPARLIKTLDFSTGRWVRDSSSGATADRGQQ